MSSEAAAELRPVDERRNNLLLSCVVVDCVVLLNINRVDQKHSTRGLRRGGVPVPLDWVLNRGSPCIVWAVSAAGSSWRWRSLEVSYRKVQCLNDDAFARDSNGWINTACHRTMQFFTFKRWIMLLMTSSLLKAMLAGDSICACLPFPASRDAKFHWCFIPRPCSRSVNQLIGVKKDPTRGSLYCWINCHVWRWSMSHLLEPTQERLLRNFFTITKHKAHTTLMYCNFCFVIII
jgi:hypothetical protein